MSDGRLKVYTASKTRHAPMWLRLRDVEHYPIVSSWIDEAGIGETSDWPDLWARCISEASSADVLLVYAEPGDVLKGAWVEVGAALASGKKVFGVGCEEYSIRHHKLFETMTLDAALAAIRAMKG